MESMSAPPVGAPVPHRVGSDRGTAWWSESWALFTRQAGMWVALGLILLVVLIVLSLIPVLGSLASSLLTPALMGGWMLAARKVEAGGMLEVRDLFEGFKDKVNPLLVLGAFMLAGNLVIVAVVGALGMGAVMGAIGGGMMHSGAGVLAAAGAGFLAVLVAIVLGLVMAAAFWFAPALVVFGNVAPVDALKASIAANLSNIAPFLIYGLLYLVAAIVASMLFGLGWLVLGPLTLLSIYVGYKDIFEG